ncbi:MAG TPA: MBOAT family protein [Pseudomonadales bacterium]|nr:MBOAT family protein [Pseudomonadales bacterium]
MANVWLVVASLYFYAYWNPRYLLLITLSILFNFALGEVLQRRQSRVILVVAITVNLSVLAYFKYAGFIFENISEFFGVDIPQILQNHFGRGLGLFHIQLPLAISFFTFLQIAYLVDCYQKKVSERNFIHYTLFVTYFPHLIAGPLVHHTDLMPEFSKEENKKVNWDNVFIGLYIFAIGLFKKVIIADTFAVWANTGFDSGQPLGFYDAWGASLSYTLQLYFDFSGYSDMAIGASRILNIALPQNFNSPYKALDIQDFWRRWHMTLSRWLRDYLYIPLGGNRKGSFFTGINLLITFLLGGLWHGASWNFVIWGGLHGVAVTVHREWQKYGLRMPKLLAWAVTFLFVNIAWVFFRAKTLEDSFRVLRGMIDTETATLSESFVKAVDYFLEPMQVSLVYSTFAHLLPISTLMCLFAVLPVAFFSSNASELAVRQRNELPDFTFCLWVSILLGVSLFFMLFMSSRISAFIYFNF